MIQAPVFKNKLQKAQITSRLARHRAQLDHISRASFYRYPFIDESYKHQIYENKKGLYFKEERTKQIYVQNQVLLTKMQKIRGQKKRPSSFWLIDRSHSLNQIVKKDQKKKIQTQNIRILKKILSQKPHISSQKLNKSSIQQQKLSTSISKVQKYRLPQLPQFQGNQSFFKSQRSIQSLSSINKQKPQHIKMDLNYKEDSKQICNKKQE